MFFTFFTSSFPTQLSVQKPVYAWSEVCTHSHHSFFIYRYSLCVYIQPQSFDKATPLFTLFSLFSLRALGFQSLVKCVWYHVFSCPCGNERDVVQFAVLSYIKTYLPTTRNVSLPSHSFLPGSQFSVCLVLNWKCVPESSLNYTHRHKLEKQCIKNAANYNDFMYHS